MPRCAVALRSLDGDDLSRRTYATAEHEAYEAFRYIQLRSPDNAARWYEELFDAIQSLREFPKRCGMAPESRGFREGIRHLIFGNFRVLFVVRKRTAFVLHIRHAARRPMRRSEIVRPAANEIE